MILESVEFAAEYRQFLHSFSLPICDSLENLGESEKRLFTMLLLICDIRYLIRFNISTFKAKPAAYIDDYNDIEEFYPGIFYIIQSILGINVARDACLKLFRYLHSEFNNTTPERYNSLTYSNALINFKLARSAKRPLDKFVPQKGFKNWSNRKPADFEIIIQYFYDIWNEQFNLPLRFARAEKAYNSGKLKIPVSI